VVDAALHDTAPVAVGGDLDTMLCDSIIDELVVVGFHFVNALLDDMVAIQVLNEAHHTPLQRISY